MSGVYIKGIKMPESGDLHVVITSSGFVENRHGFVLDDVVAFPVPDHGRLGDLDALAQKCDAPHWCVWLSEIEDAPTIIPAEKEDN